MNKKENSITKIIIFQNEVDFNNLMKNLSIDSNKYIQFRNFSINDKIAIQSNSSKFAYILIVREILRNGEVRFSQYD